MGRRKTKKRKTVNNSKTNVGDPSDFISTISTTNASINNTIGDTRRKTAEMDSQIEVSMSSVSFDFSNDVYKLCIVFDLFKMDVLVDSDKDKPPASTSEATGIITFESLKTYNHISSKTSDISTTVDISEINIDVSDIFPCSKIRTRVNISKLAASFKAKKIHEFLKSYPVRDRNDDEVKDINYSSIKQIFNMDFQQVDTNIDDFELNDTVSSDIVLSDSVSANHIDAMQVHKVNPIENMESDPEISVFTNYICRKIDKMDNSDVHIMNTLISSTNSEASLCYLKEPIEDRVSGAIVNKDDDSMQIDSQASLKEEEINASNISFSINFDINKRENLVQEVVNDTYTSTKISNLNNSLNNNNSDESEKIYFDRCEVDNCVFGFEFNVFLKPILYLMSIVLLTSCVIFLYRLFMHQILQKFI